MTSKQISKAERTRGFIIEKAAPLFNKKGYSGTSLNDLLEATQLTKGSLYGNFSNKEDIAFAAFEHNLRWIKDGLVSAMGKYDHSVRKLLAMTQFYRENLAQMMTRGGCPLVNTGVEADDNMPFLHQKVKKEIQGWIAAITEIIDTGIAKGEISQKTSSASCAMLIVTLIEGGILLCSIVGEPLPLLNALNNADTRIKEISIQP